MYRIYTAPLRCPVSIHAYSLAEWPWLTSGSTRGCVASSCTNSMKCTLCVCVTVKFMHDNCVSGFPAVWLKSYPRLNFHIVGVWQVWLTGHLLVTLLICILKQSIDQWDFDITKAFSVVRSKWRRLTQPSL
jgi:hypothetical protein